MFIRLLLGMLAPAPPDQSFNHPYYYEEINTSEKAGAEDHLKNLVDFETPAKFHVGMLAISLIAGLAFGGFVGYTYWMEKNVFLSYITSLVIALVCRTFFSIIFDGAILLGTPLNVGGGNTLIAFEQICLNLVLAFWLTLTIYMHARVQRNFNSEPNLRLYQYGVPGVAVFFAFVWIFTMQDQLPSVVWWLTQHPFTQWVVNTANLLFLLIQLALVVDIVRMMMKTSLDNDSTSLLRKVGIMLGVLVLIFWLQFGLSIGKLPHRVAESGYLYFFYFVDGLECALVCLVLYFLHKWVLMLVNKVSSVMSGIEELTTTSKPTEVLLIQPDGRSIVTLDSVFTNESKKWINSEEGAKDVIYSNVVEPERLKKTLELYKRLNILPSGQVTVVEGEEFYDCQMTNSLVSESSEKSIVSSKQTHISITTSAKVQNERVQKKNAFYSSKYLVVDSKKSDIPKYLETRPSVSTVSEKDREERRISDDRSNWDPVLSDELVRKWLRDNSEIMQKEEGRKKIKQHKNENKKEPLKDNALNATGEKVNENEETKTEENDEGTNNSIDSILSKALNTVIHKALGFSDLSKKTDTLINTEGALRTGEPKTLESQTNDNTAEEEVRQEESSDCLKSQRNYSEALKLSLEKSETNHDKDVFSRESKSKAAVTPVFTEFVKYHLKPKEPVNEEKERNNTEQIFTESKRVSPHGFSDNELPERVKPITGRKRKPVVTNNESVLESTIKFKNSETNTKLLSQQEKVSSWEKTTINEEFQTPTKLINDEKDDNDDDKLRNFFLDTLNMSKSELNLKNKNKAARRCQHRKTRKNKDMENGNGNTI